MILPISTSIDVGLIHRIRYVVVNAMGAECGQLSIDTTRPETILGDQAVAIHPEDQRYKVRSLD